MFALKNIHKYKRTKFRFSNCSLQISVSICYLLLFLLAITLQYYMFVKYSQIRKSPTVYRIITANEASKTQSDWLKLKRNYFKRRQKWKILKSKYHVSNISFITASGTPLGRGLYHGSYTSYCNSLIILGYWTHTRTHFLIHAQNSTLF